MRMLVVAVAASVSGMLAGCAMDNYGQSGNYAYYPAPQTYSSPSWTQMPSSRSSCGTGRNFC